MLRERKDQCDLCDYNGVRQLGVLWMVVWLFQGSVCLLSAPSQGGGVVFLYIIFTARVAFRLLAPSACRRASRMSSASRCVVLVLKIA